MKPILSCLISCVFALAFCDMLSGCSKPNSDEDIPAPVVPGDTTQLAQLLDQLQFQNMVKKTGEVPAAPSAGSLQKSFKDTLYLVDGVKIPISFLHQDTTKNVSGVYVGAGGSFYYVAAELEDLEEDDTVSVILMGFDKMNFQLPISFNITITPFDGAGTPIQQYTVPVKIEESNDDPTQPASCGGLALPPREDWNWTMSYIIDETNLNRYSFMNYPSKVHGAGGQFIKGCCKDGNSFYNTLCASDTASQRTLLFPTFFQFPEESIDFDDDGSYDRLTIQENANPDPPASNFCGNGKGVVDFKSRIVLYVGKWSVTSLTVPPDFEFFYTKRNYLTMQTTSSSGTGYGNAGGFIHFLNCRLLILIEPGREGLGGMLYKIYKRRRLDDPKWFV